MFKTNVCVTSVNNSHQTHNLCTHVKLPAKTSQWLISNVSIRYILSQNYFLDSLHADLAPQADSSEVASLLPPESWPRRRSTLGQSTLCMYMVFSRQARLEPDKSGKDVMDSQKTDRKNAWALLLSLLAVLPHLQIRFGNDLDRGLCAWQCKYSAWLAQTLAAFELSRTSWTSRDWIRGDFALKKSTRPTIHTASHYSKFSRRNRERMVGGR